MEWLIPIVESVIGSLVRAGLLMLSGYLVKRHLVSQSIADQFVSDGVTHAVIAAPALVALGWSIWSKVRGRVKLLTALQATPGTTERQLDQKIDAGLGVPLKAGAVLLACVLGASSIACGPKPYHAAVVANSGLAAAIFTLQDEEIAAHKAGLITDAKHAEYKAVILKLLQAGDDLTLALKDWDPSKPAPANIGAAVADVSNLLGDLNLMTPTASKVIFAAQTVLSVLRGTGVLPSDAADVVAVDRRDAGIAASDSGSMRRCDGNPTFSSARVHRVEHASRQHGQSLAVHARALHVRPGDNDQVVPSIPDGVREPADALGLPVKRDQLRLALDALHESSDRQGSRDESGRDRAEERSSVHALILLQARDVLVRQVVRPFQPMAGPSDRLCCLPLRRDLDPPQDNYRGPSMSSILLPAVA